MKIKFDNTYTQLPAHFYSKATSEKAPKSVLIEWNTDLAVELGIDFFGDSKEEIALYFSGNKVPEGAEPIAMAYSGHQFGHFSLLGDGRALLLGEVVSAVDKKRFDIQLKGSGPTPYSRRGDGKSSLGPVIREYILCEAMYHLGVPTTRALAAVASGENILRREGEIPAGVFTRVASSHIRVGTFSYFYAQKDVEGLRILLNYTVCRHFPELEGSENLPVEFLRKVIQLQAELVAHWMDIGFIHGVMNTDNMSVAGITIDYGPCAFMDHFNIGQVYSYIDQKGRYAYNNQISIAQWNLSRLAESLLPLISDDEKIGVSVLEEELKSLGNLFEDTWMTRMGKKLGFKCLSPENSGLVVKFLEYLQKQSLDYTNSFRELSRELVSPNSTTFFNKDSSFIEFMELWKTKIQKDGVSFADIAKVMDDHNPIFIPRNHQVEKAIQASMRGDYSPFKELNKVLKNPYTEQPGFEDYKKQPTPGEIVPNTFCGT